MYRRGFESLTEETHVDDLPVDGEIPEWLEGRLLRNGPAQFEVGDQAYNHWFDGLAMLHAFGIQNGRVSYRNRFLESSSRREAMEQGEIRRSEFATDPCQSIFGRIMSVFSPSITDNASVNIGRLGDEVVALTETPMPVAFDPETLETAGVVDYADDLDAPVTTAHPHVDPDTGRTWTYAAEFGRQCRYHVCSIDPNSTARNVERTLEVDAPSYMHSFGMTDRHVVLTEWPHVVRPLDLLMSGKPFIENYDWQPERGTRIRVIRKSDGAEVATATAEPRFAFHHVNAFERGNAVVCDVVTYPDASVIEDFYLNRLRDPETHPAMGTLRRFTVPFDGGEVSSEVLSDTKIELPRIHDLREGRSYRVVYGVGARSPNTFTDQLVKVDVETGAAETWHEAGTYPGEPVYVPEPTATGEDEGAVLSVVLDPEAERSFLLVLDAESFEERARAPVPHAIPFGFHGQFVQ